LSSYIETISGYGGNHDMRVIDLYCGVGGSAIGIKKAFPEADILGYDIRDYAGIYPFFFNQADITEFDELPEGDFYWASPPCQSYSVSTEKQRRYEGKTYPDLIEFTREKLIHTGKPFVIENVIGSPLIKEKTIILRGYNFPDLRDIRRPRKFEVHGFRVFDPQKYDKIFPYYRLISGGGGWIREPEKVKRMTVEMANKRFQVKGRNMWDVAQIVPYQYSYYICKHWGLGDFSESSEFKENEK
jgi:hypothetical protein